MPMPRVTSGHRDREVEESESIVTLSKDWTRERWVPDDVAELKDLFFLAALTYRPGMAVPDIARFETKWVLVVDVPEKLPGPIQALIDLFPGDPERYAPKDFYIPIHQARVPAFRASYQVALRLFMAKQDLPDDVAAAMFGCLDTRLDSRGQMKRVLRMGFIRVKVQRFANFFRRSSGSKAQQQPWHHGNRDGK